MRRTEHRDATDDVTVTCGHDKYYARATAEMILRFPRHYSTVTLTGAFVALTDLACDTQIA